MPKRSNTFQTLIYQIQSHFSGNADFEVVESEELIHSFTGEKREVDIVVKTRINDVPVLLCFECTSQKRKVGSPWVESMLKKHEYLPTDKLVLVSESGFWEPALRLVEKSGLALAISLKDVGTADWTEFAQKYDAPRLAGFILKLIDVKFTLLKSVEGKESEIDIGTVVFRRNSDSIELKPLELGADILNNPDAVRPVMKRWIQEKKNNRKMEFEITINWNPKKNGFTLYIRNKECEVGDVKIRANVAVRDNRIELQHSMLLTTKVAHSILDKPFPESDPVKGDRAILAVTENLQGTRISISFPDAKIGTKKIFHADWKAEEE